LRAGAPLEAVLVAKRLANSADQRHRDLLISLREAGCPVVSEPDEVLDGLTEGRDLGAILGLVRLPPPVTLTDLLTDVKETSKTGDQGIDSSAPASLFLAAVDIVDPGNVGALIRTAHAAGTAALLAAGASDPYHPRATRISRGSIFKMPVIEYGTVEALLEDLRQQDLILVGAAASGGIPVSKMVWPHRGTVIMMGNEAEGLSPAIQEIIDYNVTIPMSGGVDSYSVNAAAAIILYTARQAQAIGD
jgi:TrmH family RNA methyltransferase